MRPKTKPCQMDKVLRHLRDFGTITPMDAMRDYSIMRLGARVWDLKRRGYNVTSRIVQGENKYGEPTHWAEYTLQEE
ncbi:MAG: hypothetical protein IJJ23_03520 [Clostridia bacterium]|nr:hypothetical protein [Clostridia bacterium]